MSNDRLQARIGYQFSDPELLEQALTHRSHGASNYERLEFLGDALLNFVIADAVQRRFPDSDEGDLTRLRAFFVRESTLAEVGQALSLSEHVRLGPSAANAGGHRRRSIIADLVESLIGAVYLDAGFEAAGELVRRLFAERLDAAPAPATLKDPKTRLQELMQSRGLPLPDYEVTETRGPDHARQFSVRCRIEGESEFSGEGSSRRRAEQSAARAALEAIDNESAKR